MNNTTSSTIFHEEEEDANTNLAYSLGFSFAVLVVLIIVCYISYKCSRSWSSSPHTTTTGGGASSLSLHPTHSIFIHDGAATAGGSVDEAVLENYPKFSYSQAKVVRESDEFRSVSCSICLADYKDSDMLRLLPECGHLFHIRCIDPWLKLHPTCPLCRSSPMLTPLAEVVPLSMHRNQNY